jgi:hypothetical protein
MLTDTQLIPLQSRRCPDCGGELRSGPRGGLGVNMACQQCGAEFNVIFSSLDHGIPRGDAVMAFRNSARGAPQRFRLASVFNIFLAEPTPALIARERAAAAYFDPAEAERQCDRDGCGETYHGPAVYCSLACAEADA